MFELSQINEKRGDLMKKKVLLLFSFLFLVTSLCYAQVPGLKQFGKEGDPYTNVLIIRAGGTNAVSDVTGSHVTGMIAPAAICLESLETDGVTEVLNCMWFDCSGILRVSSGIITRSGVTVDTDASNLGYSLPTESNFDHESSGTPIGSQS